MTLVIIIWIVCFLLWRVERAQQRRALDREYEAHAKWWRQWRETHAGKP